MSLNLYVRQHTRGVHCVYIVCFIVHVFADALTFGKVLGLTCLASTQKPLLVSFGSYLK